MSIEIRRKAAQVPGGFNGGAILENRPLIPGHGDKVKPFSNLFYWAHAWSEQGSLLGEHPHEAFEIMTFVLRGKIEHYDSHTKAWKPLEAGSAQIIRAGSGLSHAERFFPGSHIFQIWFDPNLEEAIQEEPSYNDYPDTVFPTREENGIKIKTYRSEDGPVAMKSAGLSILEYQLEAGARELALDPERVWGFYVVEGGLGMNQERLSIDDFWIARGESKLNLDVSEKTKLFAIGAPKRVSYATYLDRFGG